MDKTRFTASQEKIYDDKSKLSDKLLLEIVNSEGRYVKEVVNISKLILAERGVIPAEVINEIEAEQNAATEEKKKISYNVDGPPFDRHFNSSSKTIIFITFIIAFLYAFVPKSNIEIQSFILLAMLGISVWAAMIAAPYLKKINQSPFLAVICFLFPFIGLMVVRYIGYKFKGPDSKVIFDKACEYYNYRCKHINEDEGYENMREDEKIDKLKEETNKKLNEKIEEFELWLSTEEGTERTKDEINTKRYSIIREFEFEGDPIPIIDIAKFSIEPEPEEEENAGKCPACGYAVSSGDKECPDCGLAL